MVQPLNYMMDVRSPFEQALKGFESGQRSQILAAQEERAADRHPLDMAQAQQSMDIQRSQEGRAADEFEQRKRAVADAQAKAEAMQADLLAFAENPGATSQDYAHLMMKHPNIASGIKSGWDLMNEGRREATLRDVAQIYSAIDTGRIDIANELLEQRLEAARNSGDDETAQQMDIAIKTLEVDPRAAKTTLGITLKALGGSQFDDLLTGGRSPMRSSQILDDGTVVGVTDQGPVVYGPTGEMLTGQAAADAVKVAQEYGASVRKAREAGATEGRLETQADLGADVEGAKRAGTSGIELANKTFERIGPIRSNIANLQRAIDLVEEEGANTGALARMLPNWSASSIELSNLRNQLGLDVVGSATFGALSESELQMALDTALPEGMSEGALSDWLTRKRDAQEALVDNLTMQAQFLSKPGRTLDQWIEFTRSGGETPSDMREWMRENPVRGQRQADGGQGAVDYDRAFLDEITAKIQDGVELTEAEAARLSEIAGE